MLGQYTVVSFSLQALFKTMLNIVFSALGQKHKQQTSKVKSLQLLQFSSSVKVAAKMITFNISFFRCAVEMTILNPQKG